jgi:hypothetical protein
MSSKEIATLRQVNVQPNLKFIDPNTSFIPSESPDELGQNKGQIQNVDKMIRDRVKSLRDSHSSIRWSMDFTVSSEKLQASWVDVA